VIEATDVPGWMMTERLYEITKPLSYCPGGRGPRATETVRGEPDGGGLTVMV